MGSNREVKVRASEGDVVIASFTNSIGEIPKDIKMDLYKKQNNENKDILHGESSNSNLQYDADELTDSQYIIGVYDKDKNEIKLIPKTKMFSGRVLSNSQLINDAKLKKSLKRRDYANDGTMFERRSALGQEFGTKKAKKAISEAEKNRIDSELLQDSQIDIVDGIKKSTKSMLNREQMAKLVEKENRVIPKCYPDATSVEEIYPIGEIVPDEILELYPLDIFFTSNKDEENKDEENNNSSSSSNDDNIIKKLNYLPYIPSKERGIEHQKKSIFGTLIQNILENNGSILNNNEDNKWRIALLSFTSMLLGLYFNKRVSRRDKLMTIYDNVPPSRAINYMLANFTNTKSKNKSYDRDIKFFNVGPKEEDKLLCHIIVLLISLNEYRINLSVIASDLSLKPSKLIALVKTLGCTIVNSKDNSSKVAILKVPFKAPEMVRRFKR